jgi:hypothetical protein
VVLAVSSFLIFLVGKAVASKQNKIKMSGFIGGAVAHESTGEIIANTIQLGRSK